MVTPAISIRNLDHLGLVAVLCQELGIARMIDAVLPKMPPFMVSHGEALVAMILNGLGCCLDALFAADVSALYQAMAEQVVARLGLKSMAVYLDIIRFHVAVPMTRPICPSTDTERQQ